MRARWCLLAVVVVLASAACGDRSSDPPANSIAKESDAPRQGGQLVIAVRADVDSWNPYTAGNTTALNVLELLYPRLVRERWSPEEGLTLEPWLAESWSFTKDRSELAFRLRDAHWSDIRPLSCADVKLTWQAQHAESLAWPGIYIKKSIESMHCADDSTAVFRFSRPSAYQVIDANDDAVVSQRYAELPFDEWMETSWEERMVSLGPFRLESVAPGQEAVLVRAPEFWMPEQPYLDRLVFRVYADVNEALAALEAGDVDLVEKVPPSRARAVEAREDLALVDLPGLSWTYIAWNQLDPEAYVSDRQRRGCTGPCPETAAEIRDLLRRRSHPVLSDPRVRRALTLAIDRQDLVEGPWQGYAKIAVSPLVSLLGLNTPAEALPWDPARAAALLDEAGWRRSSDGGVRSREGQSLELEIIVNADNRLRREVLSRIAASLQAVGVGVKEVALPRREFVARARNKDFDGLLGGWRAGTRIEPQSILHCDAAASRGNNLGAWCDEKADALAEQAAAAESIEEAALFWRRWEERFVEEQPYTMLYEERVLIGLNQRIQNATPSPLNPYAGIERWWIQPAREAERP